MATFEIVPAKRWMCGRMARALRAEHQAAAIRVGIPAHKGIRDTFGQSYYRKALLVDGTVSAMWGVAGSPLAPVGFMWLVISDQMARFPKAVVKIARAELTEMIAPHVELCTTIIDGDEAAKRLAVFLGWHVSDHGRGASAETRMGRKRLTDFIDREPDLRIPFGNGAVLKMGYHPPYAEMN